MKKRYRETFDKIAPIQSDEELLRAVLERKAETMNSHRKIGKKAIVIFVAAAIVLGTTAIGVGAAVQWDLSTAIRTLFDRSSSEDDSKESFMFKEFDLDSMGSKPLDQSFERNGYTIQTIGVVADMHSSFLFYDVILDDSVGYTYREGDEVYVTIYDNSENYYDLLHEFMESEVRMPDGTYDSEFDMTRLSSDNEQIMLGNEGNIFHCAHRYDLRLLTLKDKEIVYDLRGLHAGTSDYAINDVDFLEHLTIRYDFIKDSDELFLEGDEAFSLSSGEYGAITSVNVTPLSLNLKIRWEMGPLCEIPHEDFGEDLDRIREYEQKEMDEINKAYQEVKVRFKDGTIAENGALKWDHSSAGGSCTDDGQRLSEQYLHLQWAYPINISDIESILVGDGEFRIE